MTLQQVQSQKPVDISELLLYQSCYPVQHKEHTSVHKLHSDILATLFNHCLHQSGFAFTIMLHQTRTIYSPPMTAVFCFFVFIQPTISLLGCKQQLSETSSYHLITLQKSHPSPSQRDQTRQIISVSMSKLSPTEKWPPAVSSLELIRHQGQAPCMPLSVYGNYRQRL